MDKERLEQIIGAAQNRLGISISTDDPIFALIFLNEAVLNDAMQSAFSKIEPVARAIYNAEKTVPGAIQGSADDAIQRLTQVAGSVIKVSDSLKGNLDTYIRSGVADARNEITRMGIESQNKIQAVLSERLEQIERATSISKIDISSAAAERLDGINKLLGDSVRDSLSEYSDKFAPRPFKVGLMLVTACLLVGILSTTLTYSAVRYLDDTKQQQARDIGVAVQTSWQQFDEKTRAIILSKINQRRDGSG